MSMNLSEGLFSMSINLSEDLLWYEYEFEGPNTYFIMSMNLTKDLLYY